MKTTENLQSSMSIPERTYRNHSGYKVRCAKSIGRQIPEKSKPTPKHTAKVSKVETDPLLRPFTKHFLNEARSQDRKWQEWDKELVKNPEGLKYSYAQGKCI